MLVEGLPPADETSLVGGPLSAATDAFFRAAMDQMKRISKSPMETIARVVRRMQANECLGKRMHFMKNLMRRQTRLAKSTLETWALLL